MSLQGRLAHEAVSGSYGEEVGRGSTHACNCTAMEDAETVLTGASVSGGGLEE